jgi:hypothetical protein
LDAGRFDRIARLLSARQPFTRRGMSGIAAGTTASLALGSVAQGKKGKKCKKKKCKSFCPDGADSCADEVAFGCGLGCVCRTGTSRTICGEATLEECIPCEADADCDELTGKGSVCQEEVGTCECEGEARVCVPPCAEPLPAK